MIKKIKDKIKEMEFRITPISMVTNPFYIIRKGLFTSISGKADCINGTILDVGCGSKPYEYLFKNATQYIGMDIVSSGHNHAYSKIDIFYDGEKIPFPESHFDAVVSFEVFEHIFNIDVVIKEIHRVLRDGGKLLISVPFAWDEHEIPYDYFRYTSFGILKLLKKHGFDILHTEKTTTYFLAVSQMLIAYLSQHVLPRKGLPSKLGQITIIFPLTLFSVLMNKLFKRRFDYFCNTVTLAQKTPRPI